MVTVGFRMLQSVREELDRIAAGEGVTRSALLVRIVTRYIERYPADES